MNKATHIWTMHMKTDKQGFEAAFYKVLDKSADKVIIHDWQAWYAGRIYPESAFKISKRYEKGAEHLDGTIAEDANGLLLELKFKPLDNGLYSGIMAFIISVLLSYAIAAFTDVNELISDVFWVGVVVILLPVFGIAFCLSQWFTAITNLGVKASFIKVLSEIEKEAERSRQ